MATAVTGWARESPLAAFDWIQNHGGQFPEKTTLTLKRGVVYGVAARDPRLAFDLLRKSGIEDTRAIAGGILAYPGTPETRTAALAAYREYFAELEDVNARKYAGLEPCLVRPQHGLICPSVIWPLDNSYLIS